MLKDRAVGAIRAERNLRRSPSCARSCDGARVLLLSAVLPNLQELAEWVTGDPKAVASSVGHAAVDERGGGALQVAGLQAHRGVQREPGGGDVVLPSGCCDCERHGKVCAAQLCSARSTRWLATGSPEGVARPGSHSMTCREYKRQAICLSWNHRLPSSQSPTDG